MAEVGDIRDLLHGFFEETGGNAEIKLNTDYSFNSIKSKMSLDEEVFVVADNRSELAGLLSFSPDTALINFVFVKKPHRKKGVARMLVEFVESFAKEKGKRAIKAPIEFQEFFQALGFEPKTKKMVEKKLE